MGLHRRVGIRAYFLRITTVQEDACLESAKVVEMAAQIGPTTCCIILCVSAGQCRPPTTITLRVINCNVRLHEKVVLH